MKDLGVTRLISVRAVLTMAVLMICVALPVKAAAEAEQFIQNIAGSLEQALKKAESEEALEDEKRLDAIIDKEIIPHLDLDHIARKVSGAQWQKITEQTLQGAMQEAVVGALKRTYRVALASYSGERIVVSNSKEYPNYSLVRVQVKTGSKTHALDFALRKEGGNWKVFDVSVDGIVFTKTLHNSLQEQFKNKALATVISDLRGT